MTSSCLVPNEKVSRPFFVFFIIYFAASMVQVSQALAKCTGGLLRDFIRLKDKGSSVDDMCNVYCGLLNDFVRRYNNSVVFLKKLPIERRTFAFLVSVNHPCQVPCSRTPSNSPGAETLKFSASWQERRSILPSAGTAAVPCSPSSAPRSETTT